jgi:single-strand DNA-binding protein
MSFAKVVLSGTVTSEPEKRFTPNNHAVTSFYLSVETMGNTNRQGGNEPFSVKITCWRNLAEAATTQIAKGDSILVEGKLLLNSFQTPEGVQKKLFEIEANTIDKLPGKPEPIMVTQGASEDGGQQPGAQAGYNASARTAAPAYDASYGSGPSQAAPASGAGSGHFSSEDMLTEDDIPF